ncbi:hypothetical protein [Marinagarivorans cellulosilyticus]|nr:hypothetical protein [Marinagarivorans cellulosilyticus]
MTSTNGNVTNLAATDNFSGLAQAVYDFVLQQFDHLVIPARAGA